MIDREMVIKGLYAHGYRDCKSCPYWGSGENGKSLCTQLAREALALLKEQEAVNPIPPEDEFSLYRCGNCYHQLFRCIDKYCSRCGRAVKWK